MPRRILRNRKYINTPIPGFRYHVRIRVGGQSHTLETLSFNLVRDLKDQLKEIVFQPTCNIYLTMQDPWTGVGPELSDDERISKYVKYTGDQWFTLPIYYILHPT